MQDARICGFAAELRWRPRTAHATCARAGLRARRRERACQGGRYAGGQRQSLRAAGRCSGAARLRLARRRRLTG